MKNKKWYATGIIAVVFIIACSGAEPSEDDQKRLDDAAKGGNSTQTTAPKNNAITEGSWRVGSKQNLSSLTITPGEYTITTPEDGILCTWQTVKNFKQTGDYLIGGGVIEAGKNAIVDVPKNAKGLILTGDCLAKKSS